MARRGDELHAEPPEVEDHRVEDVDVRFAGVAAARADLPQLERAAEDAARFVVNGPRPRQMLIRGVGPSLASYGVTGVLADPTLALFDSAGRQLAANDNWGDSASLSEIRGAAASAGAFTLAEGSKDSALLTILDPGVYTVQVSGVGGATGVSLLEIYEVP